MATKQDYSKTMGKEMHQIMDHAKALVDATSGDLDERITSARAALKERLDAAKGQFGELEDRVLDQVKAVDEFVHVKPYYPIGGAFVAGLFLGWLMSRK